MKIGSLTTSYPADIEAFKEGWRRAQRSMQKLLPKFACPCCNVTNIHPQLATALEKLMELFDMRRFKVHSGYRCAKHNEVVGGSPTSRHLTGQAIDFHITGLTLRDMYEVAQSLRVFKGIGVYKQWNNPGLHCDTRKGRARWEQVDGVYRKGIKWNT